MNKDLFGMEVTDKPVGKYQIYRVRYNYKIGTPERCCKICKHSCYKEYSKKYYKCLLQGTASSMSSDIRLRNVCDNFVIEVNL